MSTLTIPPPALVQAFRRLAAEWHEATRFDSGPSTEHPAYRGIVALGPDVVPVILDALAGSPDWWFAALRELTGVDPVPHADRGRLRVMAEHWVAWGRSRGLV
jgi:hypothetical protein